ncbi:MAG: polymer-forming cytoskeletal protein [Ferruginibacter sp.]|nr:polymer-forming cytoskeletal protein [Cytophagales bacterium]
MFGNNKETNGRESAPVNAPDATSHIAKGTTIEGNVETAGNLRIDGKIVGNVKNKGKVFQGDTSLIDGNVLSQNAELAGEIKGKVEVADLLILKATSIIHGDIVTSKLVVESGATFNGSCKMGAVNEIKLNGNVERRIERQSPIQPAIQPPAQTV